MCRVFRLFHRPVFPGYAKTRNGWFFKTTLIPRIQQSIVDLLLISPTDLVQLFEGLHRRLSLRGTIAMWRRRVYNRRLIITSWESVDSICLQRFHAVTRKGTPNNEPGQAACSADSFHRNKRSIIRRRFRHAEICQLASMARSRRQRGSTACKSTA